jgi:hypothetical protein
LVPILCLKEAMVAIRSILCALVVLLAGGPAAAMDLRWLFGPNMPNDFYAGVGLNYTHHTGYLPGTTANAEEWVPAAKVFGGWRIYDRARLETAFHYHGTTEIATAFPLPTSERSYSVSETLLLYTPPVQELIGLPTFVPLRVFGRVGGAYKFIHQQTPGLGEVNESGLSYHLGFGLEWELGPTGFVRFEYEYISKVVTGTDRVVDVQHTPISAVFGARF